MKINDITVNFNKFVRAEIAKDLNCKPEEVYMVWLSKTLQNIKGLFSSDVPAAKGMYYEATFNGDKQELYLDKYQKLENTKFEIDLEND